MIKNEKSEIYDVSSLQQLTYMEFIFACNVKQIYSVDIFCRIVIITNKFINIFKLQPTV